MFGKSSCEDRIKFIYSIAWKRGESLRNIKFGRIACGSSVSNRS